MCRLPSIDDHDKLSLACNASFADHVQSDATHQFHRDAPYDSGQSDAGPSPEQTSSSQAPVGLDAGGDLDVRNRTLMHHDHTSLSSYAHSPSPQAQAAYSPRSGHGKSYSPARSLGYPSGSDPQALSVGTDTQQRQSTRARPTPASNFSALFPAPQVVTSVTTVHQPLPPFSSQYQSYSQSIAHPSQATSSQPSPLSSNRYHPYSQLAATAGDFGSISSHPATPNSSGSPAPPSLSHSASSATHSLVSSRPTSRAVSASGFGRPHHAPNFKPPNSSFSSFGFQDSSEHLIASAVHSKSQRPTSVPLLHRFTHNRPLYSFTSSTEHLPRNSFHSSSISSTPYPNYSFDVKQEEELKLIEPEVYQPDRSFGCIGRRETQRSNSLPFIDESGRATAPYTQSSNSTSTASTFGTGAGNTSYAGRDLTAPGVGSVSGPRGLLAPYTTQDHLSLISRQKSGYTTGLRSENQFGHLLSDHSSLNPTTHSTTMSGTMYNADVDMGPLESYDDDGVLGTSPRPAGYDAAEEYSAMMNANTGTGKKDEKQVRRRSSKACDQCRKSKCKCERTSEGEPCKSCTMLRTSCTFLGPSRKRGPPKGYIDAIESRLHQTEALVGIMLALANPERGVLDGDDPVPDGRARSLLEDLRNNDPLAREIIERVDRGAYGTKSRRNNAANAGVDPKSASTRGASGSGDERSSGSAGTVKEGRGAPASASGMAGPPASIQGRGRMVGLGQEMEASGLATAHPSNEWQDTVAERLKAAARSRNTTSSGARQLASGNLERDKQRRRVHSPPQTERSLDERGYPQSSHRQGMNSAAGPSDNTNAMAMTMSATRFSPPAANSYGPSMYSGSAIAPPSASSSHSSFGLDSGADENENVEGEEGIAGGVGQLSINEEKQVRFHGKASGLHLLGQKSRVDGRNKGGIWHFPKARVWPPVAPTSAMYIARQEEAEACERAARARLPSRDVQEHLLELYFTHVHPNLPIVHKETFLRDFKIMHDDREKKQASTSNADPADRGRPAEPSLETISRGDRSVSSGSASDAPVVVPDVIGGEQNTLQHDLPPIPTLLLLAIFSIAARYAPIAHGTTASPLQILFNPSRSTSPMQRNGENSTKVQSAPESDAVSPNIDSPAASKKMEDAIVDLEADSALPEPNSGHMWIAGDGFLERAKVLLDRCYASSRASTCQALILMGYREIGIGAMAHSWLYIGMAVRMAQDLGMHRSSDNWSRDGEPIFSPIEQQIRKRIWYACVIMDKYVSAYIGRPLSIFEADYDTRLPSVDESEELELWAPHESTPNAILSDPVELLSGPVPPFTPVPGRVISCFNESARLSSILAMIIQAIYCVNPVASRHLEAVQLERTLDRWYMDLPDYLRFDTSVKSACMPPPNVLILHMQYWCVVILLHRPFIPHFIAMQRKRLSPGSPVDQHAYSSAQKNFNLCVSAANHITSIVSIYQERFCLKRCSVFLSYYIFTAGIMHMTRMATNPDDPQASIGLSKCMDVLKRIQIVWPSAGRAYELLHGAKDDLPDYDLLPVMNSDRSRKRSADEPQDIVLLGDPSHLHNRNASAVSTQLYPPNGNGHRYDPTMDIGETRPLGMFNSYNRWSSDNTLGFPSGLSTSVLPQQYSTGLVDDRTSPGVQRSAGTVSEGSGRYAEYWSDYSMGQPSSMLGSMYDLSVLSNANQNSHSAGGQQASQHSQHVQGLQGTPPLYMNDHYGVFNPLPPP